ncbi:MAG TPA: 50S ribosomal protein L24 [Nitrososphaeraceae archaeon]
MNNYKVAQVSRNVRDSSICATLKDNLRQQYKRRSVRIIKGDSVKVMRGEYVDVEGKVEKVNTERGTLSIEGIQREKVRGGNVKVQIHASNVIVTSLHLDDKRRQSHLQAISKPTVAKKEKSKKQELKSKNQNKKKSGKGSK